MSKDSIEVLLIEDDQTDARLVAKILERDTHFNFTIHPAATIEAAFSLLQKKPVDLILLDLSFPDASGLEALQKLKNHAKDIPIIILSGLDDEGVAVEAVRNGAQDYLVKDELDGRMLPRLIRHAMERKRGQRALQAKVDFENIIAVVSTRFLSLAPDQMPDAINDALSRICAFLKAGEAYLCVSDAAEEHLSSIYRWPVADKKAPDSTKHFSLKHFPWLTRRMQARELIYIRKLDDMPTEAGIEKKYLQANSIKSAIRLPLFFKDKFVGYFGIDMKAEDGGYSEDILSMLRIFGEILAVAHRRRLTEAQLEKLSLAVEQSPSIVLITDAEGKIEYVNPKFVEVTGYSAEEVAGKSPNILKSGKVPDEEYRKLWETITAGREWQGEFINRKKNGELYWERALISSIKNSEGAITHYLAVKEDITKRKWAEETIQHMAYYDPLTDLPNRMLFNDRLGQALAQARRKNQLVAVLFLDLDRFKMINDTLGHTLGDLLLRSVAERLKKCLREGDTIARMGGDEFTFLLTGILQVEEAVKTAQNILEVLKPPFNLEGHEAHITPSIGISIFPYDGSDSVTLVKNADAALNRAKEQGRTNYQLYTPVMNAKAFERLTLENSLRKALEKGEFTLHYQPQVNLYSGEIIGMEALIRWEHPDLGMVSPAQFIPMAEETGLIVPIGEWVLRTACAQNKAWQNMGYRPMNIAVNLSARQFNEHNLADMVADTLKETGLDPQWLDLEITESIIMQHLETTIATLRKLHRLGTLISIDDFGTGYSSLTYLKKFPVHALKIDQSFIREITTDPDDAAITSAVIAMGHSLKLNVIAEGVETIEQLQMLRSLKCDCMQGYLFSRPVPAQTITPLLMEGWSLKAKETGT